MENHKSQSLQTRAERGEELVAMLPAHQKRPNNLGDEIRDLKTETNKLETKKGNYDEEWLE